MGEIGQTFFMPFDSVSCKDHFIVLEDKYLDDRSLLKVKKNTFSHNFYERKHLNFCVFDLV